MVVKIKKKRRRGERTYHGSHKKWRGGGSRGGRGKAGGHKHKYSYVVKYEPEHFGKRGFKRPGSAHEESKIVNLDDLNKWLPQLLGQKVAEKVEDKIKINLTKIGYEKLLGSGEISMPLIVEAKAFSKLAIKKLEEAGGKAVKV